MKKFLVRLLHFTFCVICAIMAGIGFIYLTRLPTTYIIIVAILSIPVVLKSLKETEQYD